MKAPPVTAKVAFLALATVLGFAYVGSPAAEAAFGLSGFEVEATRAGGAVETRAGAHPELLEAGIALETEGGAQRPRELTVHTPAGLLVIPTAVGECSEADFHRPRAAIKPGSLSGESCPNSSQVGVVEVDRGGTKRWFGLFNLTPPYGAPAALGASPYGIPLVFEVAQRESDSGLDLQLRDVPQNFDLRGLRLTIWGTPWWGTAMGSRSHDPQRGNCLDEATGGSLASNCQVFGPGIEAPASLIKSYVTLPPTPCGTPPAFTAEALAWTGATAQATATIAPLSECKGTLTTPKLQLMTDAAASRTGLAFNLDVNDGGGVLNPGGIVRPAVKTAIASLPEGLTINPSLGAGLGVCSETDFSRETAASEPGSGCPNGSKIGEVTVEGALGLAEPLQGSVYLAAPRANPFGTLLAVYMLARSARRGLIVKSRGKIEPDPRSGRLLVTFDELPRLLYTHFSLTLREGQRSALLSPPACGIYSGSLDLASWADPTAFEHRSSSFAINRGEGGGPCPAGGIPFAPGLVAGSLSPAAGAFTPFYLRFFRSDSEAEITSYSATFPPGLLGKIAGIATCPDGAIAAAAHRSGAEEQASPSCPATSSVGHTMAGYGVGGVLAWAPGGLYLAGPYHGAPLSVVAIDAATIGPFDLGTVVVRQAIKVDPRSAQVSLDAAGSDPIPHILAGIPLHLRDIRVYVDRPGFMVNPTSCDPMQITSHLGGAGANPFDPGDDGSADSTQRYQVLGCTAMGFRPGLTLRLRGSVKHGGHPSLQAVYKPRRGANLRAVSVTLPSSLFLAQEQIDQVCTRVQFSAGNCPARSVYGTARAVTPLLDEPLEGPVYVRSSRTRIPDLVADLHGRGIEIEVPARIDSSRGGIRANFESLPDAPVASFTMTLFGGRRGLLANSEAPCRGIHRANARFVAQSNLTAVLHPAIKARCKPRRSKHRHLTTQAGSRR